MCQEPTFILTSNVTNALVPWPSQKAAAVCSPKTPAWGAEAQYTVLGHTECLISCRIQVSTAVLSITAKAKKKEKEKEKEKKEEEKMEVVGAHIEI